MKSDNHNNKKAEKDISFEVKEQTELMRFLIQQLPSKNRHNIKTLLGNKQVLVCGKVITQFNHILNTGQKVKIVSGRLSKEKLYKGISIVYEDHHLIVIDKQAGVLSIATDSQKDNTAFSMLSSHVKEHDAENKIFIVHRLDRDTSGLMLFAKSENIKELLQESWNDTIIERTYVAVAEGKVNELEGTITSYLKESSTFKVFSSQDPNNGLKAVTHFDVLKTNRYFSLLKLNLETGRKNQIRVHMEEIGHSIIGDKKYGAKTNPIGRLGLHALVLSFTHPITKEVLRFETNIPKKFLSLFD